MQQDRIGILAFVPEMWSDTWMSRHHILKGLSEYYKVLWVSSPIYVESVRKNGVQATLSGRGLKKLSDRFWCYAPRVPADYTLRYSKRGVVADSFRAYHILWQKMTISYIKRLLKKMEIEEVILYIWRPEFHWTLGRFSECLSCYHIVDEYSFDPGKDHEISEKELKLIEHSDLVFIHSKTLMEKKGYVNPKTYSVPNGVDFEFYRRVLEQNPPDPEDMAVIPHPRIGYIGHIKRHIDLSLLYDIAKSRPDWSIILIGPVREEHVDIKEDVDRLRRLANVHFLGGKPTTEIPLYINGLDVCLMPYRKTNYTKYIYPLKMHEYFACGKPVVATELENLKEYARALEFADNARNWILAIEKSLKPLKDYQRQSLVDIARDNSWSERVERICQCVISAKSNSAGVPRL